MYRNDIKTSRSFDAQTTALVIAYYAEVKKKLIS